MDNVIPFPRQYLNDNIERQNFILKDLVSRFAEMAKSDPSALGETRYFVKPEQDTLKIETCFSVSELIHSFSEGDFRRVAFKNGICPEFYGQICCIDKIYFEVWGCKEDADMIFLQDVSTKRKFIISATVFAAVAKEVIFKTFRNVTKNDKFFVDGTVHVAATNAVQGSDGRWFVKDKNKKLYVSNS